MGRYKRFLYTRENIPRATAWRYKRRGRVVRQKALEYQNPYNSEQVLLLVMSFTRSVFVELYMPDVQCVFCFLFSHRAFVFIFVTFFVFYEVCLHLS